MQTFSNQLFPLDISYGASGGPEYATDVVVMKSGKEQRNCNYQRPRYRYNVAHGVKTKEQLEQLISFFRNHKGQAIGFCFKDWMDYQAIKQPLKLIANNQYQLVKLYEVDERIISKPVKVELYVNNKKIKNDTYKIDYQSGIISFNKEITEVIYADFEFYVPVRFASDKLSANMDNYGSYSWLDISLIEVIL
jgi:uncharacterized protein (TIGR02217 family)